MTILTRSMTKNMELVDDVFTVEEYNKEDLRKTINKLNPEYNPYYPFYILISFAITGLSLRYVF